MKTKILAILFTVFAAMGASAQTAMKYQVLVADAMGRALPDTEVTVGVTIRAASATGDMMLNESHTVTTSAAGIAYLTIGADETAVNRLADLDWEGTPYFLEVTVDSGAGAVSLGTQQIMSVPRAAYAATAGALVLTSPSGKKFKVTIDDNGNVTTTGF